MDDAKLATGLFVLGAIGMFVGGAALFNLVAGARVARMRERQYREQLRRNLLPARFWF